MKNELILSPALFLFKIRVDLLDFVEYMDTKKNNNNNNNNDNNNNNNNNNNNKK